MIIGRGWVGYRLSDDLKVYGTLKKINGFQKATPASFVPFRAKHRDNRSGWVGYRLSDDLKVYGTLKKITQDYMGLYISKRFCYSFEPFSTKFHDTIPGNYSS